MSLTVLKCKCAILFGESGRIAPHIIIRLCVKTAMFFKSAPDLVGDRVKTACPAGVCLADCEKTFDKML